MATTIPQAIEAVLEADATLMATLTGGVYTERGDGRAPINPTDTAAAYSTDVTSGVVELLPCCVIRTEASVPDGSGWHAQRVTLRIGVYQKEGYGSTQTALARIRALLHNGFTTLTNGHNVHIYWLDDIARESFDDSIEGGEGKREGVSYEAARYVCVTAGPA